MGETVTAERRSNRVQRAVVGDVAPHADVLLRGSDGTVVAYQEGVKRATDPLAAVLPDGEVIFPPRRRFSRSS